MKNIMNSVAVFEDIWMNTQEDFDDDRIEVRGFGASRNRNEVEESNILLNPDLSSMEWRG